MTKLLVIGAGLWVSAAFTWSALPAAPLQERPPREDYNSGAYLYRAFCATCHGETGMGDGPVADIAGRRPADLTVLTRNSGGTYPLDRVMRVLENAEPIPGHEPPAMPNWQNVFKATERGDERVIRKRLEALAEHVETLQQK